jgi:hypothetical protein
MSQRRRTDALQKTHIELNFLSGSHDKACQLDFKEQIDVECQ